MTVSEARLAFLFADLVGSTRLFEEQGDGPALAIVSICRCSMNLAVTEAEGQVVKTLGDGIMAVFPEPAQALAAAQAMVRNVALLPGKPGLRVGLHFGPALAENGDYFGDTVNVAARLMEEADPGQVLISLQATLRLPSEAAAVLQELGSRQVKGRAEALHLYQWQDSAPVTAPDLQLLIPQQPALVLTLAGQACCRLGPTLPVVQLGSGEACEVRLSGQGVAPAHARIEWQGEYYALVDASPTGSYIHYPGQAPVFLRHEEAILQGRGKITLGAPDHPLSLDFMPS